MIVFKKKTNKKNVGYLLEIFDHNNKVVELNILYFFNYHAKRLIFCIKYQFSHLLVLGFIRKQACQ